MTYAEIITVLYICGLMLTGIVYINDIERGTLNRIAKAVAVNTILASLLLFLGV